MTYQENMQRLLDCPATHYIVKDILKALDKTDCVDAVNNAYLIHSMMKLRCDEIFNPNHPKEVLK